MKTEHRIKFLRSLTPYTQHDVAEKLSITQPNYGHIETGRIGVRKAYESELGRILRVKPEWLQLGPEYPITDNALLLFELPPKDPDKPQQTLAKRKIFETADSIKKFLGAFLEENAGEKDVFVEELSDAEKLYIFPLFHKKMMVFKICGYRALINVIDEVLADGVFIRHIGRNLTRVTFEGISSNKAHVAQAFLDEHGYKSSQIFVTTTGGSGTGRKPKNIPGRTGEDFRSADKKILGCLEIVIEKIQRVELQMDALKEELEKIRSQMDK
ncbi:XRE family transcriptional regulator [bacterium]|nr:XRE family transcriptional regulator [bacterium]